MISRLALQFCRKVPHFVPQGPTFVPQGNYFATKLCHFCHLEKKQVIFWKQLQKKMLFLSLICIYLFFSSTCSPSPGQQSKIPSRLSSSSLSLVCPSHRGVILSICIVSSITDSPSPSSLKSGIMS